MEKILVNNYGGAISFNTDTNAITPKLTNVDCNIYRADSDGQVITTNEVIDVKAGEFILTCVRYYDNKDEVKVVVISDPAAIHDLGEWYQYKLSKQKNESC